MTLFPQHITIVIVFSLGMLLVQFIDVDHKLPIKKGLRCISVTGEREAHRLGCNGVRGILHSHVFQILWFGATVGLMLHWMYDGVLLR